MIKQTLSAVSIALFSGFAFASEVSQPSWEFGCKLDAQAAHVEQVNAKIVEVKANELNTWTFDEAQSQTVASR
jgi:hypothetical protein